MKGGLEAVVSATGSWEFGVRLFCNLSLSDSRRSDL